MIPEYTKFIATGELPASMSARSKIMDIARHTILQQSAKLSNPIARGIIREQIELAAIRGNVPSIEGKIQSIK